MPPPGRLITIGLARHYIANRDASGSGCRHGSTRWPSWRHADTPRAAVITVSIVIEIQHQFTRSRRSKGAAAAELDATAAVDLAHEREPLQTGAGERAITENRTADVGGLTING